MGRFVTNPITCQNGGEITINLVLTIKLEGNSVSLSPGNDSIKEPKKDVSNDKVKFLIPEIETFEIKQFDEIED